MLTKILVTLLVIAGAIFYIRKPARASQEKRTSNLGQQMLLRYGLYAIIALSLTASAGYWLWNWQEGNQIVTVTIVSPMNSDSVIYKVRKKNITNNEIVTLDGVRVRLSNQERIIVANPQQE